MKENKTIIWIIPIIVAASLYLWIYKAVSAEPMVAPDAIRIDWEEAVQITDVSTKAEFPVMSIAPDNSIMVAYHKKRAEDSVDPFAFDIYYAESTNQGDDWVTGTIHTEAITNSSQVAITYDASNTAHAVWMMGNAESIVYADETMWGANATTVFYTGDSASTPEIIASGANTLDVVWSGLDETLTNKVYHTRSTDGGGTWSTPVKISGNSTILSPTPALAMGDDGTLYVVWEVNLDFPGDYGTIFYAEWGGVGAWSTPKPISNAEHDAHEASILITNSASITNSEITVIYTQRESKENQWLYLTTCPLSDDCTESGNWTVGESAISGSAIGVNAESPWNVFSNLIEYDGCMYAHFHGTHPVYDQENELIWGANSCNGWTVDDEKVPLTMPEVQAVFPSLVKDDTYLYLAYQQNALDDGGEPQAHQIFFQRGQTISVTRNFLDITFVGGNGSIELTADHNPFAKVCTKNCQEAFDAETLAEGALETTIVRMVPTAANGYTVVNITNTVGSGTTDCGTWAVDMSTDRACTVNLMPAPIYLPIILK